MRKISRRTFVAVALAGIISSGVSIAASPTPAAADSGCADVMFIGLRGSGEKLASSSTSDVNNMGPVVGTTYGRFKIQMEENDLSVKPNAILYPALTPLDWRNWPKFIQSVDEGVRKIEDAVQQVVDSQCENEKIVLAGYSQGFWAVKKYLQNLELVSSRKRITAILGYGDPTLYPHDQFLYPARKGRFIGGISGQIYTPTWVPNGRSYCEHGDPICHGDEPSLAKCTAQLWGDACPHMQYGQYTKEAANWLASLFSRSSQPRPTPEPTRPTPTQPAPAGAVHVKNMYLRDVEEVAAEILYCNEQFQMVYTIESSFRSPVQATVRARAFDHDWVNTQTTIQPGANNIFTPATVPLRAAHGSYTWEVSVDYPGGNTREQGSFKVDGACGG